MNKIYLTLLKYRISEKNMILKKLSLSETFAVWLNCELLAFRGHKLSRMTKIWTFREHKLPRFTFSFGIQNFKNEKKIIEENKLKIFRWHKLVRMPYVEKLCGHKLSRKGPKTPKPWHFLPRNFFPWRNQPWNLIVVFFIISIVML